MENQPFKKDFGTDKSANRPEGFRPREGGSERRPFGERSEGFRPREGGFERRPFGERSEGFRPREGGFERRPQGDREGFRPREGGFERQAQGDREGFRPREGGFERRPQGDREGFRPREGGFERRPQGDREGFRPREGGFDRRPQGGPPYRGRSQVELPPALRRVESLKTDKGRERESAFLLEGVRCVREVLSHSPEVIEMVYAIEGFDDQTLLADLAKKKVKTETLSKTFFEALASTETTQGVLAVARPAPIKPNWETAQIVALVDAVQDPGNLGAIFRSSLGFGVDALVLGKGTCDPFNPKVVRGSSGTFLRVPFEQYANLYEKILFLLTKGFSVIATTPHATQALGDLKLKRKVAFLIGNEGNGADQRLLDMCNEQARIPMGGNLESLNVAVAHGIISFELNRMRQENVG